MKRTGALALTMSTTLLLAACGGGSDSSSSGTSGSTGAAGSSSSSSSSSAADAGASSADSAAGTSAAGDAAGASSAAAGEDAAVTSGGTPMASDGTNLVIWADDLRAAAIKPLTKTFTEETGVKVNVQIVAQEKLREQFKDAVDAGSGPDIAIGAHDWLGELVQGNIVAPVQLAADVQSQFVPESIDAVTYEGQTYAVPYSVESLALIRNTELAPDAPKTMEDLVTNGKKLVADGKAKLAMVQEVGKDGNAYSLYPYLASYGGGIFPVLDKGGFDGSKVILDSAETVKGAEKISWLAKEKAISTSMDSSNVIPQFAAKKAAYMISGPWAIEQVSKAGITYAIDPIPDFADGGKTSPFLGVQAFYVSAKSKNPQIAQTFVQEYVPSEEVQVGMFQADHRPPALTAARDKVAGEDKDVEAWGKAAEGGTPMPNIPAMNAVWGPLGKATADIVNGKDAAKRMATAQAEVEKALKSGR